MNKDDDFLDDENTDIAEIETNKELFESSLNNLWNYSDLGQAAQKAAMTMLSTKTGMYANIPLYCKGDGCPYAQSCRMLAFNLAPIGEPCVIETAKIQIAYEGYRRDFDLDNASYTDLNLVKELINYDIKLDRCDNGLNKSGELVEEVFAGVSQQGEEFTKPEINKYVDVHDKLARRRNEIYNLLQATRKDKKGQIDTRNELDEIMSIIDNDDAVVDIDDLEDDK